MTHLGTQKIETERLVLRRFELSDAEAMFKNWASDPEVTKYLTWPTHGSAEVSKAVLKEWTASYEDPKYYQWAIVLKSQNEPIGSISAVKMREKAEKAEIGYCIGKAWWHQGITSEALLAVIDFLINEVGFNRIESEHDVNNPNSGKVMKKCGMKYEGTLRQGDWNNQGLCDTCIYAVLKSDLQS